MSLRSENFDIDDFISYVVSRPTALSMAEACESESNAVGELVKPFARGAPEARKRGAIRYRGKVDTLKVYILTGGRPRHISDADFEGFIPIERRLRELGHSPQSPTQTGQ